MTNERTLQAIPTSTSERRPETVAIPMKYLPYLRFMSAILNKPLNEVAARFLKQKR